MQIGDKVPDLLGYDENGNYVHGDREVSPAGVSLRIGIEW